MHNKHSEKKKSKNYFSSEIMLCLKCNITIYIENGGEGGGGGGGGGAIDSILKMRLVKFEAIQIKKLTVPLQIDLCF